MQKTLTFNLPAFLVLIIYPILIICGCVIYQSIFTITKTEIILAITSYYICNISIGVGLHRLWSHGAFKTTKWIEFILMVISSGSLQGPVLAWVSDHKLHHAFSDTDKDPHTPIKYPNNKIKGFLWAHLGWMIFGESSAKNIDRATLVTLGKNKMLLWQLKHYWSFATFMNVIPPILLGLLFIDFSLHGALGGYLAVGLGRAVQQQMTFCVNSVMHTLGSRKYAADSSGDVWWLTFLLLGENWHNFHHAFGRDYRNGHKWYHFDIHKLIIDVLHFYGWAWDLVITPNERIVAKKQEVQSIIQSNSLELLEKIEHSAQTLTIKTKNYVNDLAHFANNKIQKTAIKLNYSALQLLQQVKTIIQTSEKRKSRIVRSYTKKLETLQKHIKMFELNLAKDK